MIRFDLKTHMDRMGISISQLSQKTGIARSTLTPMANRPETMKGIQFDTLDDLCTFFGLNPKDFIKYKPRKYEYSIGYMRHGRTSEDTAIYFGLSERIPGKGNLTSPLALLPTEIGISEKSLLLRVVKFIDTKDGRRDWMDAEKILGHPLVLAPGADNSEQVDKVGLLTKTNDGFKEMTDIILKHAINEKVISQDYVDLVFDWGKFSNNNLTLKYHREENGYKLVE